MTHDDDPELDAAPRDPNGNPVCGDEYCPGAGDCPTCKRLREADRQRYETTNADESASPAPTEQPTRPATGNDHPAPRPTLVEKYRRHLDSPWGRELHDLAEVEILACDLRELVALAEKATVMEELHLAGRDAANRVAAYLADHRARYPYDAKGVIADLPAAYNNGLLPEHELLEEDLRAVLAAIAVGPAPVPDQKDPSTAEPGARTAAARKGGIWSRRTHTTIREEWVLPYIRGSAKIHDCKLTDLPDNAVNVAADSEALVVFFETHSTEVGYER